MAAPSDDAIFARDDSGEFRCRICTTDAVTRDWRQHATTPRHAATLRRFDTVFGDKSARGAACRVCGVAVDWEALRTHAEWHKVVPWYEPPDRYRSFFRNHIREWDSRFYCDTCDEFFPEWSTAYIHIGDERHRRLGSGGREEVDDFVARDETAAPYSLLVREGFVFTPGAATVQCGVCECRNIGMKNVGAHVRGWQHSSMRADYLRWIQDRWKVHESQRLGQPQGSGESGARLGNGDARDEKNTSGSFGPKLPCIYVVQRSQREFSCKICDLEFTSRESVVSHVEGSLHATALEKYDCGAISLVEQDYVYHCGSCDCPVLGIKNVHQHVRGFRHKNSVAEARNSGAKQEAKMCNDAPGQRQPNDAVASGSTRLADNHVERLKGGEFYCKMCDAIVFANIDAHIAGKNHSFGTRQFSEYVSFKEGNDYHCSCCDCTLPGLDNVYSHIRGNRHAQSLYDLEHRGQAANAQNSSPSNNALLPETYIEKLNSSESHCRLCDVVIKGVPKVQQHVTGENHLFWAQQLSENITFKSGNNYHCKLCDCSPPGLENVYSHIRGSRHAQSLYDLENRGQTSVEVETSKPAGDPADSSSLVNNACLPENHIEKLNSSESHCRLCDVVIKGVSNVWQHVTGAKHLFWIQQLSKNITFKSGNSYHCKLCDCSPPGLENVYRHIRSSRHEQSLYDLEKRGQTASNETSLEVETSKPAKDPAESSSLVNNACLPENHIEKLNSSESHCRLCDVVIKGVPKVQQHVTDENHLFWAQQLLENITYKSGNNYHCKLCDCSPPGLENVYGHIRGSRHAQSLYDLESQKKQTKRENLAKAESTKQSKSGTTSLSLPSDASFPKDHLQSRGNGELHCRLCDEIDLDQSSVQEHLRSRRHLLNAQRLSKYISFTQGNQYRCKSCACMIPGVENVYRHVNGVKHTRFVGDLENRERANCGAESTAKTELPDVEIAESGDVSSSDDRILKLTDSISCCRIRDRENLEASAVEAHAAGKRHASEASEEDRHRSLKATSTDRHSREPIRYQPNFVYPTDDVFEKISCSTCGVRLTSSELHSHSAIHLGENFTSLVEPAVINETKGDAVSEPERRSRDVTAGSRLAAESLESLKKKLAKNIPTDGTTKSSRISESALANRAEIAKEERRSPSKSSVNRRIAQLLNAVSDEIHGMRDKLERAELGMRLCAVNETGNAYCLICRKEVADTAENCLEHLGSVDHCEYLEGMEKDHALFELVPGQFSEFDLVSQYMEEISDDVVRCRACDEDVDNVEGALRTHIDEESHQRAREAMRLRARRNFEAIESRLRCDWYDVHRYWCVPCAEHFETELGFARHLRSTGHAIVGRKSRNGEFSGLAYDFCAACGLLWFGFRFTRANHCRSLAHRWAVSGGNRGSRDLPKTVESHLRMIERFVGDATRHLGEAVERVRDKQEIAVRDLEVAVRSKFPRVKAFVFGSRANGLTTGNCDLEIFVDCDNLYDGKQSSKYEILYLMSSVQQCLCEHSQSWNVDAILASRSSILKATHVPTGLTCEMSFENGLEVENAKLIRYYTDIFPLCRELMLFLNQWLVLLDLVGPQGISCEALHWYVIFYLQKNSALPSVASLIARKNVSHRIAGWEVGASYDFANDEAASNNLSVREALMGFFAFYEKFDHRHDVACPLLGREIEKRAFADPQSLPEEMAPYVDYTSNSAQPRPFRIDSVMCIQHPFDLQRNLAESVSKAQLSRFRASCAKSLSLLSS